jgi:hypothetical protein
MLCEAEITIGETGLGCGGTADWKFVPIACFSGDDDGVIGLFSL